MQMQTGNGQGQSDLKRLGAERPQRIVIVRALPGLGDFLCCVPAWRALRAALPNAEITLLGLPSVQPLVRRFEAIIDAFLEFPGFPGIAERVPAVHDFPAFLQQVQAQPFDLALQMHGDGSVSNFFTILLGARRTAGFYVPGNYCHDPETFLAYPQHLPEVQRHLALMAFLGIRLKGTHLEFPLLETDRQAYEKVARRYDLVPGQFVCLHPGASEKARRWSTASFAAVGDLLAQHGLRVVLTGTAAEAELTRDMGRHMVNPPVDLAGQTDLGTLALLLKNARLLLCNDTGVSHLAAATGTPSVVLFVASDPGRWAPLDRQRHRAVAATEPTDGTEVTVAGANGDGAQLRRAAAGHISLETVVNEIEALLDREVRHVA